MPDIDEKTRDATSPVWDMSQERVFMENLTNQRFNFFLVVFAFVIAGAINSKSYISLQSILCIGAILCSLLAKAIFRINLKLTHILNYIKADSSHPITIIDQKTRGNSVRWITGKFIPIGCSILLWVCLVISLIDPTVILKSVISKTYIEIKLEDSKGHSLDSVKIIKPL